MLPEPTAKLTVFFMASPYALVPNFDTNYMNGDGEWIMDIAWKSIFSSWDPKIVCRGILMNGTQWMECTFLYKFSNGNIKYRVVDYKSCSCFELLLDDYLKFSDRFVMTSYQFSFINQWWWGKRNGK